MNKHDELIQLGFTLLTAEERNSDYYEDYDRELKYTYSYYIGHSRRGQEYYFTVDTEFKEVSIFATKPDGNGTNLVLADKHLKVLQDTFNILKDTT